MARLVNGKAIPLQSSVRADGIENGGSWSGGSVVELRARVSVIAPMASLWEGIRVQ